MPRGLEGMIENQTVLEENRTFNLGEIRISHPSGTFGLTPASHISMEAIGRNQHLLSGIGIDWGSGTGCLSIIAAKIPAVSNVVGLEISESNVEIARENALANSIDKKVLFIRSDSYYPFSETHGKNLEALKGRVNFILANPPSSEDDDGFEYRRIVLEGAKEYLQNDGVVFLSISYQYGIQRIERMTNDVSGFVHAGVLASTEWVSFDLGRPDLLHCLELYAKEERRGGLEYTFANPETLKEGMNARSALDHYYETLRSPLSKWQTHLFKYKS